jgi:iron(III) transport system ATP-binding protein
MASVTLENIHKSYGDVKVVRGVDLAIADGEFVALLGPSGCGKTTTLRMIAGLEEPTDGRVLIGDEVVSDPSANIFIPPEKRRLGMVFQSYAVWPHMSVAQNVAYPLKLAGMGRGERDGAVQTALDMVQMGHLGARMPDQLSGGQQQRVALARALAMEPRVLLLDEPLSNLDAHLREELRREISLIRARTGLTIVYVTHDQEEALALADRIVILDGGRIRQAGPPPDVYTAPIDAFVGGFIGKASFLPVELQGTGVKVAGVDVAVDPEGLPNGPAQLMLRPEAIVLSDAGIPATVTSVTYLGNCHELWLDIDGTAVRAHVETPSSPGAQVHVEFTRVKLFPAS